MRLHAENRLTYGKYLGNVRSRTFTAVERFCLLLKYLLLPKQLSLMFPPVNPALLDDYMAQKNPGLFMLRYEFNGNMTLEFLS